IARPTVRWSLWRIRGSGRGCGAWEGAGSEPGSGGWVERRAEQLQAVQREGSVGPQLQQGQQGGKVVLRLHGGGRVVAPGPDAAEGQCGVLGLVVGGEEVAVG